MNLWTKSTSLSESSFKKEDIDTWSGSRSLYQGVNAEKIKGFFSRSNRSIYKLTLKSEWITDSRGNASNSQIKGAFGLTKITWTKNSDSEKTNEGKIEEVKIDENNRVWLIVVKGKTLTYLIPSVRVSGWWSDERRCKYNLDKDSLGMSVLVNGVTDIKDWVNKNDRNKEWDSNQNERLKDLMANGFSILRGRDAVTWDGEKEPGKMISVFKNAGNLIYKKRGQEAYKSCLEVEKYFPLDLVVIGDQSKMSDNYERRWPLPIQRISVTDTIQDVMGVRLDQVIIDNEGISDGRGKKIKWDEKFKPTITLEIKK
ncbi:hypothetical protein WEN_02650 [Mycoplasma wenyonii str. Massachusetts]|uniref:Uncharacterized protein n=1 Tax=Mycoplasma wenyonii (strain Massachusetts) TaxID=1197325 RepID=I6ZJE7_MYCWM|nr:hypothetical protein [Mycoplasma wenyonii]AFN65315.1 hypothetical protein WEN_02650 [Mycoplasma wenyonii str. Massachusetts]